MTALHALRLAASEQPEGALKSLLNWAVLHIGDQFERICELEDELKQADAENQRRAHTLNALRAALGELGELILKENFSFPPDAFAKDLSSWRNVMGAYGFKPDGSVENPDKRRKPHERKARRHVPANP